MKNNIRVLLLVLAILFLGTALTIHRTITDTDILELDTNYLNKNLSKKEKIIDKIFNDSLLLKTFANSERYPLQLKDIASHYVKESVYLYIYRNNKPVFWSNNMYVPITSAGLHRETNFIKTDNFAFVVKQKKIGPEITILALIPIEQNYLNRDYEQPHLYDFLQANNLELANFSDSENIRNIYAKDNTLLFSVKLKEGKHNNIYIQLQLLCWILGSICFIILITSICVSTAKNNKPIISIFILGITLLAVRIIDLETNWLAAYSNLEIFLPTAYAFNYFTPNIWSLLTNMTCFFWLITYSLYIKKYINIPDRFKKPKTSIIVYYLLICLLYIFYTFMFDQLATLITHSSNYQKNLSQFLYSNDLTYIHILIYCISIVALIFLTDFILEIIEQLHLKSITSLNIQLIILIQFILFNVIYAEFSLITILIGLLIIIRPFDQSIFQKKNKSIHIVTLVSLALITNIKFSEASKAALLEQMKFTISAIQSEDDIQAVSKFVALEKQILADNQLKTLIRLAQGKDSENIINEYIKKKYLSGYISKYEYKGYYFQNEQPLGNYNTEVIDYFKEKVIGQSIKVDQTDLFYKSQITGIGIYEYFSIIRIPISSSQTATLILDFSNRNSNDLVASLTGNRSLLTNSQKAGNDSYAIYRNGQLISQKGKYIYPNKDNNLPQQLNEFINYESTDGYYHLIYKNSENETIVVSKANQAYWQFIAITSVIFLLLYGLSFITKFLFNIITSSFKKEFRLRYISYQIRTLLNTIRYSTRIQTLVISSVLIAILISGLITFFSVRIQTQQTREANRLKFVGAIANKLELKLLTDNSNNQTEYLKKIMGELTDVVVTNFNLFDNNGKLFFSTQPSIYEQHLLSPYMNPNAYIELNVLKKTATHNEVAISDLKFESVYATIRNSNYNTIAYLAIPYYDAKELDNESRDILLNTIFNIYTIIIIVFAFLSIYIANKITEPLQLIRKKLSTTNLDDKMNEPLYWEKNDEIGLLIKDYNYMLIKLEENAKQLRNVERESAWREMAKQVAHEIKNPLTPMKLGIQHLSRSFHENDPRLKERFEKVSTSFIEQIDALAHIANEFSAFAKLPDTNLVPIDINLEIEKSIAVYQHSNNTVINFHNNTGIAALVVMGDRDQSLRAFNNLLKNAIEATSIKRKHRIIISIDTIENEWIKISIQDNGDGIPTELRENIFKPNFTTKSSGTGLGLAFVKQTVDVMGGRIHFESKLNIGTTFYLELPLHNEGNKLP